MSQTIPAMPCSSVAAAVDFYGGRLGFELVHHDEGFAVMRRDEAVVHLWQADDESWRERDSPERPVRSGAESFIAGTASCRVRVEGVDQLCEELAPRGVLHPVSNDGPSDTDYGTRELATLDPDGNLLTFFESRGAR